MNANPELWRDDEKIVTQPSNNKAFISFQLELQETSNNAIMSTPEQAAAVVQQQQVDTQNMEHSGDWDHGVEPDALAEGGEPKADHEKKSVPVMKKAQSLASKVIHSVEEMGERATQALAEEHLKDGDESHTEEEVAGMKLCVSKTVHQDSFIAPC